MRGLEKKKCEPTNYPYKKREQLECLILTYAMKRLLGNNSVENFEFDVSNRFLA